MVDLAVNLGAGRLDAMIEQREHERKIANEEAQAYRSSREWVQQWREHILHLSDMRARLNAENCEKAAKLLDLATKGAPGA